MKHWFKKAPADVAPRIPPRRVAEYRDLLMPGVYELHRRLSDVDGRDEFDLWADTISEAIFGAYYSSRTQTRTTGIILHRHELTWPAEIVPLFRQRFQDLVWQHHDAFRVGRMTQCDVSRPSLGVRATAAAIRRRKGKYRRGAYDMHATIRIPRLLFSNPSLPKG